MKRKMSDRPAAAADDVVAATAGADNWKTWAGRGHGSEDFEVLDLFRGMRRSIHNRFFAAPPPPGTPCPVCFCESDDWHVTSSCGHAVCTGCFKAYASSQVRDKSQSGPLRCPVCPRALRKSDAIAALKDDKALLEEWDAKMRDRLLRTVPAYRSCPKCSDDPRNESTGGGFVTSDCLAPHYTTRRDDASRRRANWTLCGRAATFVLCALLLRHVAADPSRSPLVDVVFMLATVYIYVLRPGSVLRSCDRIAAAGAREALFRPISVRCPCCSLQFVLPATSAIQDNETKEWLKSNTRLCPSCSAPITKNGGCNHMQCFHCKAKFCWACMRLRTTCKSYECRNGGVNASPFRGSEAQRTDDSLVAWIDRTLESETAKQRPRELIAYHFFLFFLRDSEPVFVVVEGIVTVATSLLTTEFVLFCVLIFTLRKSAASPRLTGVAPSGAAGLDPPPHRQPGDHRTMMERVVHDAMMAEAIRQSMIEQ